MRRNSTISDPFPADSTKQSSANEKKIIRYETDAIYSCRSNMMGETWSYNCNTSLASLTKN